MVAVQLPDGALGTAAGIIVYSVFCLICSILMILLVFKHREKDSYVALLAYAAFLGTAANIVQQLHTLIFWDDVKTEQHFYVQMNPQNPEIILAGPSVGLDLALFYIQYYCYNLESILTLVWAVALALSVFSGQEKAHHHRRNNREKYVVVAKLVAIILPGVLIGLLHIPAVRRSTVLFLIIADASWATSLALGSILLVAILTRYIYVRRSMWRLSHNSRTTPTGLGASSSRSSQRITPENGGSIYDRWLIIRFIIALLFIEVFQALTIRGEVYKIQEGRAEQPTEPDLSATRARNDFTIFLPGVSIGILVFLVFGTTTNNRRVIFHFFIPPRFRRGWFAPSHTHDSLPLKSPQADIRLSLLPSPPPPSRPPRSSKSPVAAFRRATELRKPTRMNEQLPTYSRPRLDRELPPLPLSANAAGSRTASPEDDITAHTFNRADVLKSRFHVDPGGHTWYSDR